MIPDGCIKLQEEINGNGKCKYRSKYGKILVFKTTIIISLWFNIWKCKIYDYNGINVKKHVRGVKLVRLLHCLEVIKLLMLG